MKNFLQKCFCVALFTSLAISSSFANEFAQPDPDELMRFGIVYAQIKQFYVHDKKDEELFANALRGLLSGLDPHSVYFDAAALRDFRSQAEGNFVGIGTEITLDKEMVKIVTPMDGSPAAKAGVKPGDYIIAINNKPILKTPMSKVISMLRGKAGTEVTITVVNEKDKKPRIIKIVRQVIHVDSVRSELLDNRYGYIRISQFQSDTGKRVVAAVKQLQKTSQGKLAGVILDLRNNPGGLLEAAIAVTDAFLDVSPQSKNKKIVYTKGRFKEAQMSYSAKSGDLLQGLPLVVLINEGSASASEIVAGALQDHKRAVLVGQRSFGKGSVQTLLPIDDKSAIKLTTALYYTPNGRSIQAKGIEPDILVENLEVKRDQEDVLVFNQIREESLSSHLKNGNGKESGAATASTTRGNLAAKDYQLSEALNVLKAVAVVHAQRLS